jgi:hypothetical protein
MRVLLAAFLLATALPALADETSGTVRDYDPTTNRLTLTDNSVWLLPASVTLPLNVTPGDKLRIIYVSNADNGWGSISKIERTAPRSGSSG